MNTATTLNLLLYHNTSYFYSYFYPTFYDTANVNTASIFSRNVSLG